MSCIAYCAAAALPESRLRRGSMPGTGSGRGIEADALSALGLGCETVPTQVVPRDQIATLTNTKQSLMPMGFGNLPDTAFRDMVWYILAPPEEGLSLIHISEPTRPY